MQHHTYFVKCGQNENYFSHDNMVKSPTWQLARIYIYTLPFANLDMIFGNRLFARVCDVFGEIYDFCQKTENETIILVQSTK